MYEYNYGTENEPAFSLNAVRHFDFINLFDDAALQEYLHTVDRYALLLGIVQFAERHLNDSYLTDFERLAISDLYDAFIEQSNECFSKLGLWLKG